MASTILAGSVLTAAAEEIKIGVLLGFTGAAETYATYMGPSAELAIKEVSDSGLFLDGTTVKAVRADTTCTDAAIATTAAEKLVSAEGVKAIVGALCSGASTAALQNVALPKGVLMISPSSTSPALTTIEDNGLFFRTAPSDARQGAIVADILMEKGVKSIALTYTNNDYGKGISDSIEKNFLERGGKVNIKASHEDGKGDYSAEVGALAAAGGDILVVAGYIDKGGKGIIQSALDAGAFDSFYLPDAMIGDSLIKAIGTDLNGSYGAVPGVAGKGKDTFDVMAKAGGFEAGPFGGESYDAAAITLLAMQAAGTTDSAKVKGKVFEVTNAPGVKIYPGELAKALKLVKAGTDIDYVGASAVELIGPGETSGSYREIKIEGDKVVTVGYR